MALPIEEIVGKIGDMRRFPVTRPGEKDKVSFVSFVPPAKPADLFGDVISKVSPAIPSSGSAILENFIVTTPDGIPFYTILYHADLLGWRQQIERGAQETGALSAKIESEQFVLSNGQSYPLSSCNVEYVEGLSADSSKRRRRREE